MEREFCQLLEFVRFKKLRPLIKYTEWYKQDLEELTYADLISNFKFRGCLRSIWPQISQISSLSLKYHIANAFLNQILLLGHEVIDLILYNTKEF